MKNKFSERLKELRKGLYMTQDDVANIVGLSKSSINMYERGEREPSIETLCKLSELFGVSIDYLLDNNNSAEQWKHLYYEADNARHEAWHKGYETCLKDKIVIINNDNYVSTKKRVLIDRLYKQRDSIAKNEFNRIKIYILKFLFNEIV